MIKGREVREKLQGHVEPIVVDTICALAESHAAQQQEIQAMAELIDKALDLLMSSTQMQGQLYNAVGELKAIRGDNPEDS